MMSVLHLWFLLILGHFVADYPLQSDFIAKGKNRFRPVDLASIPPAEPVPRLGPSGFDPFRGRTAKA
jgi:hypothetical protein